MSKGPILRSLVAERLTAAAEEIFALIERTVLEYEEELCRSKEENQRKQQLLDTVLSPQVNRAGVQFRMLNRTEESDCIFQAPAQSPPPPLPMTQEIHVEDISDVEEISDEPDPEPEESGAAASKPQGEVTVESEEQPEEPEPPCSSLPQNIDPDVNKEDDADENKTHEEVTDGPTTTEDLPKPKARRRKRKSRMYGVKRTNVNRGRHECTVCGKILKGTPNNLERHMLIHSGEKPFSCTLCNRRFTQKSDFSKHMESHEKEEKKKQAAMKPLDTFGCSLCELRFKRQVALKKHVETHGVVKKKLQQQQQQHGKESQAEHRREVGVQHEPQKIKVQDEEAENRAEPEANSEQYNQAMLIKNAMSAHAAPGDFKCDICQRTFTTRTRLKRHMIVHTGAKPFSCPVCHKLFSQKYNVRLHMAVHTNEKPFTCHICLKSYRRNDDLRTHMASHTGQILFSCVVCNAAFKQRNCLTSHMRLHTGDRPYKCSVCPKTFIQKSNLNRHERSHSGEKPFRCPVCPQRFLQRCDIRKHMAVHT